MPNVTIIVERSSMSSLEVRYKKTEDTNRITEYRRSSFEHQRSKVEVSAVKSSRRREQRAITLDVLLHLEAGMNERWAGRKNGVGMKDHGKTYIGELAG